MRHTPVGGAVTLSAAGRDDEVMTQVDDMGTGIVPGGLDRVFERFWRAGCSGTKHTSGNGLALAIVRQSTRAHGGTVTADSVRGEGPVFTLCLPVTVADPRPHD
ncbi:ATP-binding protein [Streptomyces sp. NPDC000348]|uniref:ATP-binding protein n=1 Tax=Streptomyces sp. NPDC000348 TaxID=3364538 RepID=UPI003691E234